MKIRTWRQHAAELASVEFTGANLEDIRAFAPEHDWVPVGDSVHAVIDGELAIVRLGGHVVRVDGQVYVHSARVMRERCEPIS